MKSAPLRPLRRLRIEQLDRELAQDPDAVEARAERAGLLREEGRFEEAKRDYLELLRRRPTDFTTLNDFGTLALKAGHSEAARSLYAQAVRHHPDNPTARVNLGNLLFLREEFDAARAQYEAALRADPDHIHAHRGVANLLVAAGDEAAARRHRDKGFKGHFLTTLPYRGEQPAVSLLLIVSAVGGNIPMASLIDDRRFAVTVLVAEYADAKAPLPAHHLVFNSIGDADLCREGLQAAHALLAQTDRPVLNPPAAVLKTGRAANVERLRGLLNVIVPRMAKVPRRLLAGPAAGEAVAANDLSFPLLVRALGFHTGQHFVRVESEGALAVAAADLPNEDVLLIEQLDARDANGMFRKFRAMIVDRQLYPLHLALSRHWKVHYFRADMADSPQNRLQDAAYLDDMAGFIGGKGMAALAQICAALDLDYGGIDFAVNANGDILFFEANATMVMIPLTAEEKWDYRRPAFDRVFAAVHAMLRETSTAGGGGVEVVG